MFSRSKDNTPQLQPLPVPSQIKRGRSAPSIISADMDIRGAVRSAGDIQIDGRVEGDVHSIGLVIGDKAEIHGEIHAEDVTIRGKVIGRIRAHKVLLAANSHVEGDIQHEALTVEAGAFFDGNCRRLDSILDDNDGHESRGNGAAGTVGEPLGLFAPLRPVAT
jgi:cytoskeletal protein CcmA (bactofilin family)